MFVETAAWISEALSHVELAPGTEVLDVGSSTEQYRTVEQPHIQREVMGPLEARGAHIVHLDAKQDAGVDIVCDMNASALDLRALTGRRYDLVLCAALLCHVRDPMSAAAAIGDVVAPGGHLLVSAPESYRRTLDPHDNMIRPTPRELENLFGAGRGFETVESGSVRIDDRRYYRGLKSRPLWMPIRGRYWFPLPGLFETFRHWVPALRWRESCALLRKL